MSDKTAGLAKAREERSLKKRRLVEQAINALQKRNEVITFKGVALLAGVSRQFLYSNFKNSIENLRKETKSSTSTIEGITVPSRTFEESQHIEALLRKKIEKLKKELGSVRHENARLKNQLEKERGTSEHWRQNWIKAKSK
jgi:cell division protein ZapA (FtsZ GTPase activity inhibitor)